jgi:succinate dehydrogenase / fumarate reductase, iron-sulfur subunit
VSDPGVAAASGTGGLELSQVEAKGTVKLRVFRGDAQGGKYVDYEVPKNPGMVVLDVVHSVQATDAPELACRWNCKAGKCGSCSAEINGRPSLMCMTRLSDLPEGPITVAPMKAFPIVKDLVTDVSFNYRVNENIQPFTPRKMTDEEKAKGEFKMFQVDVDRVQEFRKCIECFLCQDVCHVLRTHQKHDEFAGPRWMVRYASLEMHPADAGDRIDHVWKDGGIGMCNITKCCTEVCPEHITITDNAIIPLKERVVSERFDPLVWLARRVTGKGKKLPMAK